MLPIKQFIYGGALALFAHTTSAQLVKAPSTTFSSIDPVFSSTKVKQTQEASFKAVGNSELSATLLVNGDKLDVRGRSSFNVTASQSDIERGRVDVGALNIVFFDVPQDALNYGGIGKEKRGNLSFVAAGDQALKYDARSATLSGEVQGFVGADYMGTFAKVLKDAEGDHHSEAPRQRASIAVNIQLSRPLVLKEGSDPVSDKAEAKFSIEADGDQPLFAYPLQIEAHPIYEIEYVIAWRIEVAKRLCVQPVRFSRLVWNWPNISWDYTGVGLGFGQPEANKQWAKADVVFTWRDWKTVYNPSLFFFSTSEAYDVMDTVDDDDCVEVFFVEGDDGMHNNWGGGASFYGGESYTKIISSDGNVDAGVDFVHLAHELGHSMDLPHPTAFNSSSTNTLMCPSGYANDNPARNSQENKDNIANPLFTFALKLVSAGPDCTDSADCGACPPIP